MRTAGLRAVFGGVVLRGSVLAFLLAAPLANALDTETIVQQNRLASVVVIGTGARDDDVVQASGCVVDKAGWILATAHQVQTNGVKRYIGRLDDKSEHILTVVETSPDLDLALLKSADPLPAASVIGDAAHLRGGSALVAITTPENLEFTAARGMVTNERRTYQNRPFLQSDLPFSQGSSGGPVFDESGALVGVVFGRIDIEGLPATLICPINRAYPLLAKHGIAVSNTSPGSGEEIKAIPATDASGTRLAAMRAYNQGVESKTPQDKERLYLAALESDPQFFEAWFNLGVTYGAEGQADKAIAAYRKAELIRPDAVAVQRNLGRVLLKAKRMDDVEACFQRAVQLAPGDPSVHNDLGEAYRQSGKYDRAEASFLKALSMNADYAPARYNLGLAYVALNRPADAAQNFEGYLKAKPNAPDAEHVRAWITQLKTNGKLDKP
ncbi:MAG: serine protease [Candidatus Hydrogenedentes bacterium]|nr:serine protease [Candidatus Hydrogenedentota bacterium]